MFIIFIGSFFLFNTILKAESCGTYKITGYFIKNTTGFISEEEPEIHEITYASGKFYLDNEVVNINKNTNASCDDLTDLIRCGFNGKDLFTTADNDGDQVRLQCNVGNISYYRKTDACDSTSNESYCCNYNFNVNSANASDYAEAYRLVYNNQSCDLSTNTNNEGVAFLIKGPFKNSNVNPTISISNKNLGQYGNGVTGQLQIENALTKEFIKLSAYYPSTASSICPSNIWAYNNYAGTTNFYFTLNKPEYLSETESKSDTKTFCEQNPNNYQCIGQNQANGFWSEETLELVNDILYIINIVAVIGAIALSILDFTKAVASDDKNMLQKSFKKLAMRIIIVILLILLPTLVNLVCKILGFETLPF